MIFPCTENVSKHHKAVNIMRRACMCVLLMDVALSYIHCVVYIVIISRFELVEIMMHSLNILSSLLMIGLLRACTL